MPKVMLDFEKPVYDLLQKLDEMRKLGQTLELRDEIAQLEIKIEDFRRDLYTKLTPWQRVQVARHAERPTMLDYIENITTDFVELHGDRNFGDDHAVVGGFAKIDGRTVMCIGQQKGRDTKQNVYRNFGMMKPEGYRKAMRLMRLAEKFGRPVITFVDTPGAYPGMDAEERGQAEAIARNIFEMCNLKIPIIVVIIGEGASGGALGIGVGDRILMLENTWYSVISPESCSSILWRSWDYKEQAAQALKLSAPDLIELDVIDRIVAEPLGGAHWNPAEAAAIVKRALTEELKVLALKDANSLVKQRRKKFMAMGRWESTAVA
ncbi:MAG TPA: acetyl-CoA carboxylase carboxyltransferase subunit alpha [Candidatus Kapabacteria bacterium]|nr:acetyl-CoA carboxylase carboxyltransferase subunit alpha [Candidatus Kapabacteria bacterium]